MDFIQFWTTKCRILFGQPCARLVQTDRSPAAAVAQTCSFLSWLSLTWGFRVDFLHTMPENCSSQHIATMGGRFTSSLQPLKQIALYPRMCVWAYGGDSESAWQQTWFGFTCFLPIDVTAYMCTLRQLVLKPEFVGIFHLSWSVVPLQRYDALGALQCRRSLCLITTSWLVHPLVTYHCTLT